MPDATSFGSSPTRARGGSVNALALLGALGAAAAATVRAGSLLPGPPSTIGGLAEWARAGSPALASLAALRLVVLVGLGWLAITTAAALAARVAGSARAVRWTDAVLTPTQRRLLGVGVAVGLSLNQPLAASAASSPRPAPATMIVLDPAVAPALDPSGSPASPAALDPGSNTDPPTEVMTVIDLTGPADRGSPDTVDDAPPPEATWTIRPGDHLWGVAEATLASHGIEVADATVATYLRAVIGRNEGVFAVPGVPDLVYPGQVFVLPAPPR